MTRLVYANNEMPESISTVTPPFKRKLAGGQVTTLGDMGLAMTPLRDGFIHGDPKRFNDAINQIPHVEYHMTAPSIDGLPKLTAEQLLNITQKTATNVVDALNINKPVVIEAVAEVVKIAAQLNAPGLSQQERDVIEDLIDNLSLDIYDGLGATPMIMHSIDDAIDKLKANPVDGVAFAVDVEFIGMRLYDKYELIDSNNHVNVNMGFSNSYPSNELALLDTFIHSACYHSVDGEYAIDGAFSKALIDVIKPTSPLMFFRRDCVHVLTPELMNVIHAKRVHHEMPDNKLLSLADKVTGMMKGMQDLDEATRDVAINTLQHGLSGLERKDAAALVEHAFRLSSGEYSGEMLSHRVASSWSDAVKGKPALFEQLAERYELVYSAPSKAPSLSPNVQPGMAR